jgi:hypothetical protein
MWDLLSSWQISEVVSWVRSGNRIVMENSEMKNIQYIRSGLGPGILARMDGANRCAFNVYTLLR